MAGSDRSGDGSQAGVALGSSGHWVGYIRTGWVGRLKLDRQHVVGKSNGVWVDCSGQVVLGGQAVEAQGAEWSGIE